MTPTFLLGGGAFVRMRLRGVGRAVMRTADDGMDERIWEHRLPLILLAALAAASTATLASPKWRSVPVVDIPTVPEVVVATAPVPSTALPGLVLVRIADVILPDGTTSGVVLLEDKEAHSVLPVFMKAAESAAVREGLKSANPKSSPELLSNAIAALGGEVVRIELAQGDEEAVSSRVVLKRDEQEVFLDARPADALALAATQRTPVFTTSKMLDAQGIRRETVDRLPGGLPSRLRSPEAF